MNNKYTRWLAFGAGLIMAGLLLLYWALLALVVTAVGLPEYFTAVPFALTGWLLWRRVTNPFGRRKRG